MTLHSICGLDQGVTLLNFTGKLAITNDLLSVFCWVSQMASAQQVTSQPKLQVHGRSTSSHDRLRSEAG